MCGRFFVDPDDMADEELIALLDRDKEKAEAGHNGRFALGEIRPGDHAAVIALNRKLKRSAFLMQWGYHMNNKRLLINARSETVNEKQFFQQSIQKRRCLIPASAYFEWDHREKPLQKYRFYVPEQKPIYLAGIYRFEADSPLPAFTILTRESAPNIACFHNRMPVIIPAQLKDVWLDQTQEANSILDRAVTNIAWSKAI